MKRSQRCPKCGGKKLWIIEPYRLPNETAAGAPMPVVAHQKEPRPGFFALAQLNPVGSVDLYLCAACGYAELWASNLEGLRPDPAQGVRLLDGTVTPAGPFR